jgi:hypothetical protein
MDQRATWVPGNVPATPEPFGRGKSSKQRRTFDAVQEDGSA